MNIFVPCMWQVPRNLWNWSFRQLGATAWVLEIKPWSSVEEHQLLLTAEHLYSPSLAFVCMGQED